MPLARIAGKWTETDSEGRPLDPGAVLRRIQRQAERLRGGDGPEAARELAEAKRRLLILASKKLGAWSSEPLRGTNPLDGTGLEKTRHAQAESWVNLLEARAAGDTGLAIRAVRELRNAIQLEMEARGEIASRSSVQAVQVNVTNQAGPSLEERWAKRSAEDPEGAAAAARFLALPMEDKGENKSLINSGDGTAAAGGRENGTGSGELASGNGGDGGRVSAGDGDSGIGAAPGDGRSGVSGAREAEGTVGEESGTSGRRGNGRGKGADGRRPVEEMSPEELRAEVERARRENDQLTFASRRALTLGAKGEGERTGDEGDARKEP